MTALPELETASVPSLIAELEEVISAGSQERRSETLRRVTDLFLDNADRLNQAQIGLFDDVLCHLIRRIEKQALRDLSTRLSPIPEAPIEAIRALARDDEIAVAGPVLSQSTRLTTRDLVDIARTKSQAHLLAISGRSEIEAAVTYELVSRGDRRVVHRVAQNPGAQFSDTGFTTLIGRADGDEELQKKIGVRIDLSQGLLQELLMKATGAVRTWLLLHAPPEVRPDVERVVWASSHAVRTEATAPRDFTQAKEVVARLKQRGELNEAVLVEFARAGKYEEMVATLAELCSGSVELVAQLMRSDRIDGLLIPCMAADLMWPTVLLLLNNRIAHHSIAEVELSQAKSDYLRLTPPTARRIVRFWQVRLGASRQLKAS
jgi:uncharacterized protein (DUF2336 family)